MGRRLAQDRAPRTSHFRFTIEQRTRATGNKVGGRKSHAELWPEVVAEAKRLRRASPKTGKRLSYQEITDRFEDAGHVNESAVQCSKPRSRDRNRAHRVKRPECTAPHWVLHISIASSILR